MTDQETIAVMESKLQQIDDQLRDLRTKVDEATTSETKKTFDELIAKMDTERDKLAANLEKAKQQGGSALDELKTGFEQALTNIKQAGERAVDELKK